MPVGPSYDREAAEWKAEVERLRNGIFPGEENPQPHVDPPKHSWQSTDPAAAELLTE